MKRFYITTLGCKVNQYESDGIAAHLVRGGWERTFSQENADVCIINSCAVTSKAAMQSRQATRSIARLNPTAKIIVTGCHAETEPELIRSIPQVDLVAGHTDKFSIASAILAMEDTPGKNGEMDYGKETGHGPAAFHSFEPAVTGGKTRAYLKIQDGCNTFCSYCIVPIARGRSVSMPVPEVMEHLRHLTAQGFKEVVLTGIHLGAYGLDFTEPTSLADLLAIIVNEQLVHRFRLSSIEPGELSQTIIDLAVKSPLFCDHFHIPLQSGDDRILKSMKRPYTAQLFKDLVSNVHNSLPDAAIGADVLIGFPGETDEAFETTYNLIRGLPLSYLHVFPFSPRKGTLAYSLPAKVSHGIIKERCAELRRLGDTKNHEFKSRFVGRKVNAVIQNTRDHDTGCLKAVTSNYLTVLMTGPDDLLGQAAPIVIDTMDKDHQLSGRPVTW